MTAPHPVAAGGGDSGRHVGMTSCFNFRDMGGLVTTDGRTVRHGVFFRSDDLVRLTTEELSALRAMGIRTVVDLRSVDEVDRRGSADWDGWGVVHHHFPLMDLLPPPKASDAAWADPARTADVYLDMTSGAASRPELWRALAEASRAPFVVHCVAGRDRTGVVVAVLLGLLSVEPDEIAADYALSGRRMVSYRQWLREQKPGVLAAANVNEDAIVVTPPEVMHLFFKRFADHYGSFDEYAARLGIVGEVATLRQNLLEG
jgi:protein-tyrosine phosphatase